MKCNCKIITKENFSWNVKFAIGDNMWYNIKSLLRKTKEGDLYFKKKNNISCEKIF